MITTSGYSMPRPKHPQGQNLLFFPDEFISTPEGTQAVGVSDNVPHVHFSTNTILHTPRQALYKNCQVVISGTYRKEFETVQRTYEEFLDLGCSILSPTNVTIVDEHDGFVYMKGEEEETQDKIEARHLLAIQKANFVWLHTPEGYVGLSAALEVGFAHAAGVPVYARQAPLDKTLQPFVHVVGSPAEVLATELQHPEPPTPALKAFQEYYRRAAIARGYAKEQPKDCLLLMVEEVGELARALRKREKLVRHGSYGDSNEAHELADVFLYVVHMANVLGVDLADIVQDKEVLNLKKFLAR
jgi:NTP pyrophosphatase (non-canonical NTP hydrolase)